MVCEPPYSNDDRLEPTQYWFHPKDLNPTVRKKNLRKQIFASVVAVLGSLALHKAPLVVGVGQGALIALLCCRPLVAEAACRARIITANELRYIRQGWSSLLAVVGLDPQSLPLRSEIGDILDAIPEFGFQQPAGQHRVVACRPMFKHAGYASYLAGSLGVPLEKYIPGEAMAAEPQPHYDP